MRDDTPAVRALLSSLAGYGDGVVSYRPKLNEVTGSALGTIFLLRMLWRWEMAGRAPFTRYAEPCELADYRPGQSWQEELHFSRREYDTAVQAVCTRLPKGNSVAQEVKRLGTSPKTMVVRWQDGQHRMWWEVIEPVAGELIARVYGQWQGPVKPAAKQPAAAAAAQPPAGNGAAQPKEPGDPLVRALMGDLYEVTGTYGNYGREARGAKLVAQAINRGEYTREIAKAALIELRDDPGWHGPKGWNEALSRMTSFLPRYYATRDADEGAAAANGNGEKPRANYQPPPQPPRRSPTDEDAEVLKGRDYGSMFDH